MNYKYTLDKSSKKYLCPKCQRKRFVRYFNQESNELLPDTYGKCDRKESCGYHLPPNANKPLTNHSSIVPVPISISYHSNNELKESVNLSKNNFLDFLKEHFDEDDVEIVRSLYSIGTDHKKWKDTTVFWQVDFEGKIRAGKVMKYDSVTGKRIKIPYNHITWMHKINAHKDFNLNQCLFGLHLLKLKPFEGQKNHEIRIVESEKAAVIMCILMPQYLWLATGSADNFKESMLKPLKGYQVRAYPDKSVFEKWNALADVLNTKGYYIKTSSLLENMDLKKGADLIDLLK
jgi:hypothetical protein